MASDAHGKSHLPLLITVFVSLIVLTIITVVVAQFDFGSLAVNIMIAMAIATVKATLVALYFMHLRWENKLIVVFAILAIPFFVLAMSVMTWDTSLKKNDSYGPIYRVAP
jgi:cytochrome c oxidase subunit IV